MSDVLSGGGNAPDIIVANAPYLVDDGTRLHAHGEGEFGISLALRIAKEALARLAPGGRLVLYAGTPIVASSAMRRSTRTCSARSLTGAPTHKPTASPSSETAIKRG
jgi:methylase of polypeptide subunit release factors